MKYNTHELKEKLKTVRTAIDKSPVAAAECAYLGHGKLIGWSESVCISVDLESTEPILIPQKAMAVIEKSSAAEIDISTNNDMLIVKGGRSTTRFAFVSPDEFPKIDNDSGKKEYPLPDDFVDSVKSVAYATSKNDDKPVMKGVKIGDEIAACDGVRIAICHTKCPIETVLPQNAIKSLGMLNGETTISETNKNIIFSCGDMKIYAKKIYGEFFDYTQILTDYENHATIDSAVLSDKLDIMSAVVDDVYPAKLHFEGDSLILSAKGGTADFVDEIEIGGEHDDMIIGVNQRYLREAVKNMSGNVDITFGGETKPIIIKNDRTTTVVMPVRLRD